VRPQETLSVIGAIALLACMSWTAVAFGQSDEVDQPRTVVINVLAYSTQSDGKATGSCSPVRVTAGGANGSDARVGFFESEVGGTGAQWRSAGWTAAVTTALLTDFNVRAMRISFEYEGRVDGPSAGALMTVGALAAVRGDTIRADAAMTGTINPDGTVGPVGGIPHKIEGAAAAGMKLVLIPAGIRSERDQNTRESVDLVEHGQQLGVEVRPVFDIYTAYETLTGTELPRPRAAPSPRITLEAQRQVQDKLGVWYQRYKDALDSYVKMPGKAKLSQEIIDLYQKGVDTLQNSTALKDEGEFSAALWDRVHAAVYGYLALEAGRCRHTYASSGYRGMVARIRDNGWLESEVQKTAGRMREETPKTLDQLLMYLAACDAFIEAISMQHLAKAGLATVSNRETEASVEQVASAAEYQIIAWLDLKLACDYLDLTAAYQGAPIPEKAPWRQTSDYLRRASQANMAVFDALIVEPRARSRSLTADQFRASLMREDGSYAILNAADQVVFGKLRDYFGESDGLGYCYLATSIYTHTRAAGLLAKYYSLGAELDEHGEVVRLPRERTLAEWLTFADDQTRRNISLLQGHGIDATACAQKYDIARVKSRRGTGEKLEALYGFWSADLHSQILRLLGGVSRN
jgi:uncharacterized protein